MKHYIEMSYSMKNGRRWIICRSAKFLIIIINNNNNIVRKATAAPVIILIIDNKF